MGILFQIIFIPPICISCALAFFAYYILKNKIVYAVFKGLTTLLVIVFCAASFFIYKNNGFTLFITLLLTGIVFSLAGDIIILGRKNPYFITALICFVCTHIAYTLCFITYTHFSFIDIGTGIIIWLLGLYLYKYFYPRLKKLKIPVAIYIIVITFMVWRALSTLYSGRLSIIQGIFIATGSILFYISDITIGINMFIKSIKKFVLINLSLYYLGQLFIILSCYYFIVQEFRFFTIKR
ncbi:MAG: lysoplasmalogenase [Spirochaetales bacterium]|nr:lysoplasmalogenase [Spirochaetales bacterium]